MFVDVKTYVRYTETHLVSIIHRWFTALFMNFKNNALQWKITNITQRIPTKKKLVGFIVVEYLVKHFSVNNLIPLYAHCGWPSNSNNIDMKKEWEKKLTVTLCQINMKETINDKKSHLTSRIPFEFHDFESLHVLANDYMIYANNRLHLIDWVTIAREKCVLFGIKYEILVHYCEAVNHGVNHGKTLKFLLFINAKYFTKQLRKSLNHLFLHGVKSDQWGIVQSQLDKMMVLLWKNAFKNSYKNLCRKNLA